MPKYKVEIPGRGVFNVESPEPLSDEQAYYAVMQQLQSAPAKPPETGPVAAFKRSVGQIKSDFQTAAEAATGSAEEAALAGIDRKKALQTQYPDQADFEKVKKAYAEKGILPAGGELLRQSGLAIGEQLPQIGGMVGSGIVGSTVGPVGTVAGPAAFSAPQQYAGDIEAQAQEQLSRGEPVKINQPGALAATAAQTGMDVFAFGKIGGSLISKLTGVPAKALVGASAEKAAAIANERLLTSIAKGTFDMYKAEMPTEVAQLMLERAQAGQSLTSPDAISAYGQVMYQVGLMGPLGAPGRLATRSEARNRLAESAAAPAAPVTPAEAQQVADAKPAGTAPTTPEEMLAVAQQNAPVETPAAAAPTPDATVVPAAQEVAPPAAPVAEAIAPVEKAATVEEPTIRQRPEKALEILPPTQASLTKLEGQIKRATKRLEDANQLGEFDAVPKIQAKLDALVAQRDATNAEYQKTVADQTAQTAAITEQPAAAQATPVVPEVAPVEKQESVAPVSEEVIKEAEPAPAIEATVAETATTESTPAPEVAPVEPIEKKVVPADKTMSMEERLADRLNLPGTVVERTKYLARAPKLAEKLESLTNAIETPQKNAKRSLVDTRRDVASELDTVNKQLELGREVAPTAPSSFTSLLQPEAIASAAAPQGEPFTKQKINGLKRTKAKLEAEITKLDAAIDPIEKQIAAIHKGLYKRREVASSSTIAEEKRLEMEKLGKSARDRARPENQVKKGAPVPEKKEALAPNLVAKKAVKKKALAQVEADFKEAVESEKVTDILDDFALTAHRTGEATEKAIDVKEAQSLVDAVKKDLPEHVKLEYAPTLADIKPETVATLVRDGYKKGDVLKGAVLPDGTVLIVGDQHANAIDLEKTIFHELVGHYGIDTVIGIDRLAQYAKNTDVFKLAEKLGGVELLAKARSAAQMASEQGLNENQQNTQALREIIAYTGEQRVTESFREKAGRWLKEFVGMIRDSMRRMGMAEMAKMSTSDVFYALKAANKAFEDKAIGAYTAKDGTTAFRSFRQQSRFGKSFIGQEPSIIDKLRANFFGMSGRVQHIDKFAALSEAFTKSIGQTGKNGRIISELEATNAEYFLRFGEQRSQLATQIITNGPLTLAKKATKNGVEHVYESKSGASLMKMAKAIAPSKIGNDTDKEAILTALISGERAKAIGWDKLNLKDPATAKREYNEVVELLNKSPKDKAMFKEAMDIYQEYNAGLLDLLVATGAMKAEEAARLKQITYIPYYRVNRGNLDIELMVDRERIVRIGNLKEEPELQQLVGDSTQIMPVFTSSIQNTFMLTNMALRNQMIKETAYQLYNSGFASAFSTGRGPESPDVVRFKIKGVDTFVKIDSDQYGVPAALIVRGLEGIRTSLPAIIKAMGWPADVLRKGVTRVPTYAFKQAIRDPLTAWLTTGTDGIPVMNSMAELSKMIAGHSPEEAKLMAAGAISSNVLTGDQRDMQKALRDISSGKWGWSKLMAKADAFAMQGDAATRVVVYKDSIRKGMTEQEALLRTLESMNFGRHGLSPSSRALAIMIPFFNSQIQGLDVLYRASKGKMPNSKRANIQMKLISRGLMIAAGTIAYAAMMQDDDEYKKATPEERYGNWFIRLPFFDEMVRIPIPFELGYLFKALPEMVYNVAYGDEKAGVAAKGMGKLLAMSNPLGLPAAIKPSVETYLGKSFFGGDIESQREQKNMLPTQRYRATTTEVAKLLGSVTGDVGLTPIKIDHLIRGHTGSLGIGLVSLVNTPIAMLRGNSEVADIEQATTPLSKMPLVGPMFQPVEGRGELDQAYERMLEIQQVKGTYKEMMMNGRTEEAQEFAKEYSNRIASASMSGAVQQRMGELSGIRRRVLASAKLTTAQKDEAVARIDKVRNAYATRFLKATDRTSPQ